MRVKKKNYLNGLLVVGLLSVQGTSFTTMQISSKELAGGEKELSERLGTTESITDFTVMDASEAVTVTDKKGSRETNSTVINKEVVASGTFGTSDWTIDSEGTLEIGEGEFAEYVATTPKSGPWTVHRNAIDKIIFTGTVTAAVKSSNLFFGLDKLTTIEGLNYLDTSLTTQMDDMFDGCRRLSTIDVSSWDTSAVTNMSGMFNNCDVLLTVDVSGWDMSSVTNMSSTFSGCRRLSTIDVSSWDTSAVTNMASMFNNCESLLTVDTSSWDTSSVTNISSIFNYCVTLLTVDVSSWDTSSVTNMSSTFSNCRSLSILGVSSWDTSSVTNMSSTFNGCNVLKTVDVSNWDTGAVTNMSSTFASCGNLMTVGVSSWDTSSVTDMSSTFSDCRRLSTIDVSSWDTSAVKNMTSTFLGCSGLSALNISSWDTSSVTNMTSTFLGCSGLSALNISSWDTSSVTNMVGTFTNCSSLVELEISKWDMGEVTTMSRMFLACSKLTILDVSKWDTNKVTDMGQLFSGCSSLVELDVSRWITSKVTTMSQMFMTCSKLTILDVSKWDTSKVTTMSQMFSACSKLTILDVSKWDTSKVTAINQMFSTCSSLVELDISEWNTGKVTTTHAMLSSSGIQILDLSNWDTSNFTTIWNMFQNCSNLTSLDVSNWDISKVTNISGIFVNCSSLVELDISSWDTSNVSSMSGVFINCTSLASLEMGTHSIFLSNAGLPAINTTSQVYSGQWIGVNEGTSYTSSATFMTTYDGSSPDTYIWEENTRPQITFISNGGNAVPSQDVAYNDVIVEPTMPTRAGYTFEGWYSEEGLTSLWDFETLVTEDRTLYAKWALISPQIIFISNGGSAIQGQVIEYNSVIAEPTDPTRVGYTFEGWHSDENLTSLWNFATLVVEDRTLYAKWALLGELNFSEVAKNINFGSQKIMSSSKNYVPIEDISLIIEDSRGKTENWELYLNVEKEMTLDSNPMISLAGALRFVNEFNVEVEINGEAGLVHNQQGSLDYMETTLRWDGALNQGLLLQINPSQARIGTYTGELVWTLVDTPD